MYLSMLSNSNELETFKVIIREIDRSIRRFFFIWKEIFYSNERGLKDCHEITYLTRINVPNENVKS